MTNIRRWLAAWPLDRRDGVLLAGGGSLIHGIAQVSVPIAWIVAGVLLLAVWLAPLVMRNKRGH